MRSRYHVREKERTHFVTSTIVQWLPVLTLPACCEILVNAFAYCRREEGLRLYAWVLMDNHFHAVMHPPDLAAADGRFEEVHGRQVSRAAQRGTARVAAGTAGQKQGDA